MRRRADQARAPSSANDRLLLACARNPARADASGTLDALLQQHDIVWPALLRAGRHHNLLPLLYSREAERLGTAGAIRNASGHIDGTIVALNGDTFLELDLTEMVGAHSARRAADPRAIATLAAVAVADAAASGTLEVDGALCITGFFEKGLAGPGLINGGVHALELEVLDLIPEGRAVSIERETFPLALAQGYGLYAYPTGGFFVDIGTPEGYGQFQRYVEEQGL